MNTKDKLAKKTIALNYVYSVEHKSCSGNGWIRRDGAHVIWGNDSGESPYSIAGIIASRNMRVGETGVRVKFLGLAKADDNEPALLPGAAFSVTLEKL